MPYISGETLRARLTREKQLSVEDALRLAKEVASALDYAHRQGVVHRDIKPENILLQDGQALVADFGIALATSAGDGARMTQTGMSLGTPAYMSPEQAMGERVMLYTSSDSNQEPTCHTKSALSAARWPALPRRMPCIASGIPFVSTRSSPHPLKPGDRAWDTSTMRCGTMSGAFP